MLQRYLTHRRRRAVGDDCLWVLKPVVRGICEAVTASASRLTFSSASATASPAGAGGHPDRRGRRRGRSSAGGGAEPRGATRVVRRTRSSRRRVQRRPGLRRLEGDPASARDDDRPAHRLERGLAKRPGEGRGVELERLAGFAAREMAAQENRFEIGQLAVELGRDPRARTFTGSRASSHFTKCDVDGGDRLANRQNSECLLSQTTPRRMSTKPSGRKIAALLIASSCSSCVAQRSRREVTGTGRPCPRPRAGGSVPAVAEEGPEEDEAAHEVEPDGDRAHDRGGDQEPEQHGQHDRAYADHEEQLHHPAESREPHGYETRPGSLGASTARPGLLNSCASSGQPSSG